MREPTDRVYISAFIFVPAPLETSSARKFPSSLWSKIIFGICKTDPEDQTYAQGHAKIENSWDERNTLSPKKIFVLLAMDSINFSSRNSGVSFNLFASASLITLKIVETINWSFLFSNTLNWNIIFLTFIEGINDREISPVEICICQALFTC